MSERKIVAAESGPSGDRPRSDLKVAYQPGPNALVLEVSSKVDYLYREAIEAAVKRVVEVFGVTRGTLVVDDGGALEWVILARVEACLRRAGFEGPAVLPHAFPDREGRSSRDRLRRTRLYVPGNQPKLMLSAGLYGADGIILDLEDSVAPPVKDEARLLVRNALRSVDFKGSERMVRINQGDRGLADLDAVAPHNLHVVLIPKVEDPEQVRRVDDRTREILRKHGLDRPVYLMPIVESALGAIKAYEIASASDNICAGDTDVNLRPRDTSGSRLMYPCSSNRRRL